MTFLLWQRGGDARIASPRVVLRAAEVPVLRQANELCDQLARLQRQEDERIAAATGQAAAEGHALGLEEGRRAARDELATALAAMAQATEQERNQLRAGLAALALQVVRKMLGSFADDEVLAALAHSAARDALPARQLALVVHPDVCDAVRERLAARADEASPAFDVRSDAACSIDTCRIETEHGCIDASLEGQLARLGVAWEAVA